MKVDSARSSRVTPEQLERPLLEHSELHQSEEMVMLFFVFPFFLLILSFLFLEFFKNKQTNKHLAVTLLPRAVALASVIIPR